MPVVVGIFLGMAMLVALVGAVFTDVKLWGLVRESRKSFRRLPAEKRRRALLLLTVIYAILLADLAVVMIAPFGVRKTLTYFVIIPVLVVLPTVTIAAGIRGFRGQRGDRPPEA